MPENIAGNWSRRRKNYDLRCTIYDVRFENQKLKIKKNKSYIVIRNS
jgi:hypothetical protein